MARIILFGAVVYLLIGLRIVKGGEWLVITRAGKYRGFKKQGIHWVLPFLDQTTRVELRKVSPTWEGMPDQILETKVHEWVSSQSSR